MENREWRMGNGEWGMIESSTGENSPGESSPTHSVASITELTCPECGKPFTAEVWLIVDVAERPDLLDRIRNGVIHNFNCPSCGYIGTLNAPLLIYRPNESIPLLFSPSRSTTPEQDQEQISGMMEELRISLGEEWHDEWLRPGVPEVPRELLPDALNEGLDAVRQGIAEHIAQQIQQAAINARQSMEDLSPRKRAREILRRVLKDEPIAIQSQDLDDTFFAVLHDLQSKAEPESDEALHLKQLESQFQQVKDI